MVIGTADGFFVLAVRETEEGTEFELLHELGDVVVSGCWAGACFLYTTEKGLKYYVGGEVIVVKHLQQRAFLLGYLDRDSVAVLVDKDVRSLSRSTLICRRTSPPCRSIGPCYDTKPRLWPRISSSRTRSSPRSEKWNWRNCRCFSKARDFWRRP